MPNFRAPLQDMQFVITELAGLEGLAALPGYEEVTPDLVGAVLEEAAKLAGDVLAPLNQSGDEQGTALTKDGVVAADGFAAAYRRFVENGWNGLGGDPEYGGQGLPGLIAAATVGSAITGKYFAIYALVPLVFGLGSFLFRRFTKSLRYSIASTSDECPNWRTIAGACRSDDAGALVTGRDRTSGRESLAPCAASRSTRQARYGSRRYTSAR